MGINARLFVDPPQVTPSPYGLLSVVEFRPTSDSHWQAGVTWNDVCGGTDTTFDECISSSPYATGNGDRCENPQLCVPPYKAATASRYSYGATPFTVYAEVDCSPVDFYGQGDSLVRAALTQHESWDVEYGFWTGIAGGQGNIVLPHLASDAQILDTGVHPIILQMAATTVTGVGLSPPCALGLLESALVNCLNGAGIIHVPVSVIPVLAAHNLIYRDGTRLKTHNGNLIAAGAGYPGTGPDGAASPINTAWVYGTGPIFGYRGDVVINSPAQSIDTSINDVRLIAERTYVLGFDCCLFAALVCTECESCGSTTPEVPE